MQICTYLIIKDLLQILLNSWPLVTLVAILIFGRSIINLIDRTKTIIFHKKMFMLETFSDPKLNSALKIKPDDLANAIDKKDIIDLIDENMDS